MKKKIWKDNKTNLFMCELQEEKFPWSAVTSWGNTEAEAETKAFELRKQILEKQLETNPILKVNKKDLKNLLV